MSDEGDSGGRTRFREPAGKPAAATKQATARTHFAEPRKRAGATKLSEPVKREVAERERVAGDIEAPAAERRRGNVLAVIATITAVVLLAATIVFAVLFVRERNDATDLADTRTTVLRTAQKVAIDFSSYDYRHLDRDFAGVAAQLTPTFRTSYRSTAGALKATLSQYQAVGTAKVLDAGVATLSANRATVVVFLDQTVTSKTSTTPTVDRNRIRVILERSGRRWLVSKLDVR